MNTLQNIAPAIGWNPFQLPLRGMMNASQNNKGVCPLQNDIILGRGTLHTKHPGNTLFYKVIDSYLPQYNAAQTKFEKTEIIQKIYEQVSAAGQRFLKEDPPYPTCIEVDDEAAKKKIGHAIRYRQSRNRSIPISAPTPAQSSASRSTTVASRKKSAPVVTPAPSPVRVPPQEQQIPQHTLTRSIFSTEDLDSVLGAPGEMDLPEATPSLVLEPLVEVAPPPLPFDLSAGGTPSSFSLKPLVREPPHEDDPWQNIDPFDFFP